MTDPIEKKEGLLEAQPDSTNQVEVKEPEKVEISSKELKKLQDQASAYKSVQPALEKITRKLDSFSGEMADMRKGNKVLVESVAEFEEEVSDDEGGKKTVKRINQGAKDYLKDSAAADAERVVQADIAFAVASHGYTMSDTRIAGAKTVREAILMVQAAQAEDKKKAENYVEETATEKAKALHNDSLKKQAADYTPPTVTPSGSTEGLTIEDVKKMTPADQARRSAEIAKLPLGL